MKLALIGATGNIGAKILREAADRGHDITAIVRNPENVPTSNGSVSAVGVDMNNSGDLASAIRGNDAVIISVPFSSIDRASLFAAIKNAQVRRLLVVGGAGSLLTASGTLVIDSPNIPREYLPEMQAARNFLAALPGESNLDWTFLSPPLEISAGERTGSFRLGLDKLLIDDEGKSRISQEDFAIAMIDELEQPRHIRQRFTLAY